MNNLQYMSCMINRSSGISYIRNTMVQTKIVQHKALVKPSRLFATQRSTSMFSERLRACGHLFERSRECSFFRMKFGHGHNF